MNIRLATPEDYKYIYEINSQYIDTPITMRYQMATLEEYSKNLDTIAKEYPILVSLKSGVIVGYAYAHKFRSGFDGYALDVETTIYVDNKFKGRKVGSSLYYGLLEILKIQNIVNVYAFVTRPNLMSESLHRSRGFHEICQLNQSGYKNGKWHDIKCYHKTINLTSASPHPFIPINEANKEKLENILSSASKRC
ncbi:MAG: N-acetyltransferase family protein [Bacteroidales bacterium]|nr:N-acetyltransferase family protein [Bacteroidales bacterium]